MPHPKFTKFITCLILILTLTSLYNASGLSNPVIVHLERPNHKLVKSCWGTNWDENKHPKLSYGECNLTLKDGFSKIGSVAKERSKTISIGVLVDLSGLVATYGVDIWNTLKIAEEDINAYFRERDLDYTVKFYVEDTKIDPKIALEKVQDLYARGINLVIGPMGSGEVANIKDFVTSNKIIIISPSSSALLNLLGITEPEEKKYIFRFFGSDDLQTDAITYEIQNLGIKSVVVVYIDNIWGSGLYQVIKPKLERTGIEIRNYVEYPDPPPVDFTPYIAEIEEAVSDALKDYNNDEVAVLVFGYEEVATMLSQIKNTSPLLKVSWIGCDGTALSGKVLEVCSKASKVGLFSTLFESKGKGFDELARKYEEAGYGDLPSQYAINAYDAAWVLALSYVEVVKEKGKYDADAMAEVIPNVAKNYSDGKYGIYPVSGYIKLNEWNDRISGNYTIYYVTNRCEWEKYSVISLPCLAMVKVETKTSSIRTFTVNVMVTNVTDLAAFQFDIKYNSSLLEFISASKGDSIADWSIFNASKIADNEIRVVASAFTASPLTGSGVIAKLTFNATSPGETTLDINDGKLSDASANPISASWVDGYVKISICLTGDVNGDGSVDVLDLTYLVNVILGDSTPTACSDVNEDGSIDVLDLTQLVNIILGS